MTNYFYIIFVPMNLFALKFSSDPTSRCVAPNQVYSYWVNERKTRAETDLSLNDHMHRVMLPWPVL